MLKLQIQAFYAFCQRFTKHILGVKNVHLWLTISIVILSIYIGLKWIVCVKIWHEKHYCFIYFVERIISLYTILLGAPGNDPRD